MSRENSNVSFRLSSSQSSLDSGVSNRNEDETSSIVSSKTFETECVSKIIKILDLDDSTDSENLARQLMIKGRQVLRDHQRDVSKKIFEKQMNTNQSELLDILKAYVEHQWKETISEQWFHQFLGRQPPAIYNQVVARTAEYGSTYIKDNRLLSLTIQFLFQYDNEKMSKDNLFDKIWNTLISEGRHGIQHYKDDLATKLLKEQLENNESPLYLALKDYYRAPLQKFFNQKEINIHNDETFQITLDSVADRGWSLGLKHTEVADSIALNKLDILVEEAKKYLASKLLPIPDQPPSSDNNAGGTSALINTAANVTSPVTDKIEAVTSNTSSKSGNSTDHVFPTTTTTTTIMPNADDIRRQERIQECKMITMCINDYEKLQLSNLVEAGELMYIDQKLDCHLDKIVKDYSLKQNFSSFIQACLIPTMYLLKRHQNFDDFIESLFFKYSQVESPSNAPKLCLRMFIHVLLLNSDLSLSRKIMSLLSKRNPVPFLHPSLSEDRTSYQFVSDIFHVWDYSIPTLLSFGIGPSEGKSTLINTIFLSSFELSMSSIYFQNTIDIDFGYSFLPRRSTNIADCHGPMVKTLLEKIHELFDGFLIHVEYSYLMNNIDSIHELLNVIMRSNPYHLLIVRDAPTDQHEQCSTFLSSNLPSIKTFLLPNIADQKNQKNKHSIIVLRNAIWENIPTRCRRDMSYLKNELKLLMNREYKQHLDQMYTTIVPLERTLLQTATDERAVQRCFPEYLKFVELCELKLKLARFNFYGNDKDAVVYDVRRKIFDLENASNVTDVHGSSIIYELFSNVLNASNMLTCMELLADELKQERASIVSNADMATQLPIQKSLSLEVLWRNAIVCSQYEPEDVQKKLQRQYYQYIQAGFPFEIVDGDNFYLPYSFLFNALEPFRNRRTLVISVIGPQNSGKSTLLNYMFGTLFDVRDGRCTRGIYGSFVKTNRSDFEYIMLIDTEGLLGIEREDSEYDRRIVLFCLAVSHLVIVNMVGEVSTTLQSMLTLCADSLEKMGVTKIPQPIVHYILNQKADLNIENHQAAIDRIITDVKKFGLGNSIDIGKGTFHTLPSAFKKDGQTSTSNLKLPNVVKTAPEFIECVQSLSGEIIRSAEPCLHRANEFFDPLQWLSSSRTIFDTLQKFSDLTYYNDIHERRLDNEIREHIRNDLTKIFSTDYRDKLILESSLKSEQEIIGLFLVKQNQIQETARQNVQDLFKLLKAPDKLRERSEQFLKVQITEMFNALRTSTIAVNEREKVKLIVQNGEGGLQKLVEDTIQSGLQMSPDVASQQFDEMFNNTIRSIETQFVPRIRLEQAIKHIYTNYNIYEKEYLLEAGHITIHLSLLSNWNDSKASIAQVQDELIIRFTQLGYQDSSVAVHHFNPTTRYSRDIIKNLIYLSEDLLDQEFLDYVNQPSPSIDNHQRKDGDRHHNKNFIQRGINYVASALNGSRDDRQVQQPTVFSTDQFQLTIRDKIRNQKPPISQGTPDERNMCFGTSKVFTEVIARIIKTMEGVGNDPVRQIRTELIQKIVGLINSLIIEIDNELAPFCLSLSRPLKSTFHACAIILLTKYYYDEQINQFNQTLSALQTKKNDLKQYFINMVVPNAAVDENYAVNLGKQFKEHLLKLFVVEGQQIINTELGKLTYLNRKWIQDRCDGQLLTRKDDLWHLDYIENPTKIIEQFFKELWSNVEKDIDQKLADRKSHYVRLLTEFFFCIRGMLETASKLGAAARFVNDIFIPEGANSLDANENLINKKRCMAILLNNYFTTQTIPTAFVHNAKRYSLREDALRGFQLSLQQRKPSVELSQIMQQISAIYDKMSIGNFVVFLTALLNEEKQILDDFNRSKSDFKSIDTQDTYASLLDKVRGCSDLCPCCKRPCDVDHTLLKSTPGAEHNEHRCLSGHTLRAMNGYKFEITEEASLLMCEQIKDDQTVIIGPTRYLWSQFKKDRPNWIFDSSLDDTELGRLHGKFLTVWEKVGPRLCQKFKMKYVTHNTPQKVTHENFHYILLLDASGSMRGDRWKHLMEGVQEFLTRRQALQTDDRISIIVFSDKIDIPYTDVKINEVDITKIKFLSGGTSFKSAFESVDTCITRSKRLMSLDSVHESIAIIFMSDGESDYPEQELNKIIMAHDTVIKKFWTLALGDENHPSMEILKKINDKMNGSFFDIETSMDLARAYAEVATSTIISTVNA